MGARNQVGIGLSYRFARLRRIAELIPWNWFLGSIKIWALAGRCDNSILTRFLAPIDCLRISALDSGPSFLWQEILKKNSVLINTEHHKGRSCFWRHLQPSRELFRTWEFIIYPSLLFFRCRGEFHAMWSVLDEILRAQNKKRTILLSKARWKTFFICYFAAFRF